MPLFDVFLSLSDHQVDQAGEFSCGGGDRDGGVRFGRDALGVWPLRTFGSSVPKRPTCPALVQPD